MTGGFEEIEALTTADLLRRANVPAQTMGVGGKQIMGAHQVPVIADLEENKVPLESLQMVTLPGGLPGTPNLEQSQVVKDTVIHCYEYDTYVTAIHAAPSVLEHIGLLKGRRVMVSDGFVSEITGAEYIGELVTVNGKIITDRGLMVAMAFAPQLTDLLTDKKAAEKLRNSMQCQ